MPMERVPMTVEGYAAMEVELQRLKSKERPRIIQAIAEARAHGDLSENAEYHAAKEAQEISANSETEFITEHYWGYTKVGEKRTTEYEVTHPKWMHYPVTNYNIAVDFALSYGPSFAFLKAEQPTSVMLAEGSAITVEGKNDIVFN